MRPAFDATDPAAYRWGGYDDAIAGARARGWDVLLTLSGPVPRWATQGARDTLTRPRPGSSAPSSPPRPAATPARSGRGRSGTSPTSRSSSSRSSTAAHRPVSPGLYRGLLSAAFDGFHDAGLRRPRVLMGETSPQGTPRVVAPLTFLRGTLCLNSRYRRTRRCARPPVVGYAHHAYTTKAGPVLQAAEPDERDDRRAGPA